MVNLKSASFVVVMLLHKGSTNDSGHSQKNPRLHFGESFALTQWQWCPLKRETSVHSFLEMINQTLLVGNCYFSIYF